MLIEYTVVTCHSESGLRNEPLPAFLLLVELAVEPSEGLFKLLQVFLACYLPQKRTSKIVVDHFVAVLVLVNLD